MEKGIEKGKLEKAHIFVINLLEEKLFSDNKIASLADVTVEFVEKVKAELAENPGMNQ